MDDYNTMLLSTWFWKLIKSKFVLITHTDSIIFRQIDDEMFQYDMIGPPWEIKSAKIGGYARVGNGGYTLRRVQKMIDILETTPRRHKNDNEDIWWSRHSFTNKLLLPNVSIAFLKIKKSLWL